MIVVVGSRHDPMAAALVRAWPGALLCSAEDMTRPGWICSQEGTPALRWVIDGRCVDDSEITGIFVRRSAFYPEEFLSTRPQDRDFLAAEARAFLGHLLSVTSATVANRPRDGAFGHEAIGFEQWLPAARREGLAVQPLRLTSRPEPGPRRRRLPFVVEVAGGEAFGEAPVALKRAAVRLARALDLVWATALFDGRRRLLAVTAAAAPGPEASAALAAVLARRPRP